MHPYLDIVLRSAAVYAFMVVALRVFGRKELSQLNTTDVILILLISNSVQNAMVGPDTSLLGGMAAAAALFVLNFIVKKLVARYDFFQHIIQEKAKILIHEGKSDYKMLASADITHDELMEAIHEHGLENISEVKLAILEMDGNISIIAGKNGLKETHYKRRKNRKNLTRMA